MALYPPAVKRLLPANARQPKIAARAAIVHSAAGMGSLYGWWLNPQSRGLECHFWVAFSGLVEQYMDTSVRADANGAANGYAVSIETESSVHATERWSTRQAASIVALLVWICRTHGIPPTVMASPLGRGLAWHILFGAPGPWTRARGKTCPGPARIIQLQREIIPAVVRVLAGNPTPPAPPEPTKEGLFMHLTASEEREILTAARVTNRDLPKIRQWTNEAVQLLLGTGKRAGFFRRTIAAALKK